MADYYVIATNIGEAKMANALALGIPLAITDLALGDGEGAGARGTPIPNPEANALVSERRRAPLNSFSVDPENANILVAEQVIPETAGGWWIREMGLFDEDGDMIFVCNTPPTYKPQLSEGSGRTQVVRMASIVSDSSAVTLKVDPSVVIATREYVDQLMVAHEEEFKADIETRVIKMKSVPDMVAAPSLTQGSVIRTSGYYASGDGGGNLYEVVEGGSGTADGGRFIDLNSGLQAKGLFPGGLERPAQYGAALKNSADIHSEDYNRPPSLSDYAGYMGLNIWHYGKKIWKAVRTFPGEQASWQQDLDGTEGIGNVNSILAAYWLTRIVPGYTGPALQIENESNGATTDIGFNSDGSLDVNLLHEKLINTRGRVTIFYDQSGNGNHLTATGDARPVITKTDELGGSHAIIFENSIIYNNESDPNQFLTIPATLSGSSDSVSIAALVKFASSVRDAPICELANDDGTFVALGNREQTGIDCIAAYVNDDLKRLTEYKPTCDAEFLCLTSSSSGISVYANDTASEHHTGVTAKSFAGGKVGATTTRFLRADGSARDGGFLMSGLIISSKGLVETEVRRLFKSVVTTFDLRPQVRGNLVFDGDSISEGAFANYFNNWPKIVSGLLPCRYKSFNVAKGGGTLPSQISAQSKWMQQIYSPETRFNTVVIFAGTNDINGGTPANTVYSDLQTYIANVKAAGYSVVVCTVLPRGQWAANSDSRETERLAYNDLIRSGWKNDLGCLALIDFASERTMGSTANTSDSRYYEDGTHPTDLGYSLLATFASETITRIV